MKVVGIDLGTTNCAVAWADLDEGTRVRVFEVPQLVAPGEVAARTGLPSALYLAGEHDLPEAATALPWDDRARVVVGELARTQGQKVPARLVTSAKSWLCHPGVDRQAPILPWGAGEGLKLSPLDASARILAHIAGAWDHVTGALLAESEVIVTVPASFDEAARELTLAAAAKAGLEHVTLVEEPQAAFYAWIDAHDAKTRREALAPGERVLVCDVGGGTTDFTLIEVAADGADFTRAAVGDHLLLGGDNIDLALARLAEQRLGKLDVVQWQGLVHASRLAKEQILSDAAVDRRPVSVMARGSRLLAGAMATEITRAEVEGLVLDGFLPVVERDAAPSRARAGLAELGLPYAADAAITRHLAAFLARHGSPRIHAILFNGGAMKPRLVRDRVIAQLARWQDGAAPRELAGTSPELAVARGAAYYGLVRRGHGTKIRGGAARAFYVYGGGGRAVCVLPRGAEEGTSHELASELRLLVNRPASFRLYSATTRNDQPDAVIEDAAKVDALLELPPLVTVLRAPGRTEARVKLVAKLTELGTLELWCHPVQEGATPLVGQSPPSLPDTASKFRLTFDLRGRGGAADELANAPLDPRVTPARTWIDRVFGETPAAGATPASIMKELEAALESRRDEWPTQTIRAMYDALLPLEGARKRSAEHEARWINLAGFLLRPGVGAPLDDWRVREAWKVFNLGLAHDRDEACKLGWWILWRRVAAGLTRGQQDQLVDRLGGLFLPGPQQKARWFKAKPSAQEATEMWRVLASLERVTPATKVKLGDWLAEKLAAYAAGDKKALLGIAPDMAAWCLGRLGARAPLTGPADAVVAPEVAARWAAEILAARLTPAERIAFPLAQLARRTGDRARDLDDEARVRIADVLRAIPGGERMAKLVDEVVALEAREERVAFGDSLPTGLRLVGQ